MFFNLFNIFKQQITIKQTQKTPIYTKNKLNKNENVINKKTHLDSL